MIHSRPVDETYPLSVLPLRTSFKNAGTVVATLPPLTTAAPADARERNVAFPPPNSTIANAELATLPSRIISPDCVAD